MLFIGYKRPWKFKALLFLTVASLPLGVEAAELTDKEIDTILSVFDKKRDRRLSSKFSGYPNVIKIGKIAFYSKEFSQKNRLSCAICHKPELDWTDGKQTTRGGTRNVPTLWNVANKRWYFWDGRADSLWNQILQVLENPREHAFTRTQVAKKVCGVSEFGILFRKSFNCTKSNVDLLALEDCASPNSEDKQCRQAWRELSMIEKHFVNMAFVNLGKAIAAYVETIEPEASRFDLLIRSIRQEKSYKGLFTDKELDGLKLFIGKANCIQCHIGPDLTDNEFHDIRVPPLYGAVEKGRYDGIRKLLDGEFNLLSVYNDQPDIVNHTNYVRASPENWAQFKTPTLRRVGHTAPYMHQGQFETLEEVVIHYSTFDNALEQSHHGEFLLSPIGLSKTEMDSLVSFLHTL